MENTLPTPQPQQSSPPQKASVQDISPKAILFGIVALVVIAAAGLYLGILFASEKTSATLAPTPVPPNEQVACTLEAKLCPDGSSVGRVGPNCEFAECPAAAPTVKRLYEPSGRWADTKSYPREVTSVNEEDLLAMSCSPYYTKDPNGNGYVFYLNNGEIIERLTIQSILDQIDLVKTSTQQEVDAFLTCQTADSGTVVVHETHAEGGAAGNNTIYFGMIKDGQYTASSNFSDRGVPQFSCRQPLQMTTSLEFFILCSGGDVENQGHGIYIANLGNSELGEVLFCTTSEHLPQPVCD